MNVFEMLKKEISSFADDENEVIFERNGTVAFERQGQMVDFQLIDKEGAVFVKYNDNLMPYKRFLAKELAKLDILAHKILQKEKNDSIYVDPSAILVETRKKIENNALEILNEECSTPLFAGTKISFVTADAGHGKTALLKQYQYIQAKKYSENEASFLFWHIDLHGRDLVRLNEAIMYELGELRFSGLYYSSIITLIKHNLIILGIDGFDELAAEVGGETALGSLTGLVVKMNGSGTLIAASRRTFFNTQDYLKRTSILRRSIDADCEFNEIKIHNWKKKQCVEYLSYYFSNSEIEYDNMLTLLKSEDHPLLERPYLFTKLVQYSFDSNVFPSKFISSGGNTLIGINDVIEAFVKREVIKWKDTDKDTGKPYINFDQHIRLLSEIAQEMWSNQKDIIAIDTIQFLLAILFDDWKIEGRIQPLVIRMAESHALLIPVENKDGYRKFDHEEFKNFFVARALEQILIEAVRLKDFSRVHSFLYIAQLPDSVAQYLSKRLDSSIILSVLEGLFSMKRDEWKPTYLQPNIGTLLPYILDGYTPKEKLIIGDKITFSSLIFENKTLENMEFKGCSFINISFKNTSLKNITFDSSTFTDIRFYDKSNNIFSNVVINTNCLINMVTTISDNEEIYSEYSPYNICELLKVKGVMCSEEEPQQTIKGFVIQNSDFKKCVKRFLNKYIKSTYQYESNIKEDPIYDSRNFNTIIEEIIPMLEKYEIIEERSNKNTIQASTKAWVLKKYGIADIFKAEEDPKSPLYLFWKDVNNHK